jgi:hypothetical protein
VAHDPKSGLGVYVKPHQKPHPPIAVAGTNIDSATLQIAGEPAECARKIRELYD